MSRSWVDIDLGAIAVNAKTLQALAPGSELCAVVKADGYGHGAEAAARTALAAGATRLAVAQMAEGLALRAAGFDCPIWVLSEPAPDEFDAAATASLEPAVYSPTGIDAAAAAAVATDMTVHLKIDSGMHRVGADPGEAVALARRIASSPGLQLGSVWTHLACADTPDNPANGAQLDRYEATLETLVEAGIDVPLRHAANSAGTIAHPRSRLDVVRCGISLYGLDPGPDLVGRADLLPAMGWRTNVSFVKRLTAGEAISYGLRAVLSADANVATLPVGYADGYRRGLWDRGGVVLIGGVRRPILGVVTMDQLMVDCGDDAVAAGDEAVLIGRQGDEEISADELAEALETINYEIIVAVGSRVERRFHNG